MTYYIVNNTYTFTDYGKALAFARQINGKINTKKTLNVFKYLYASI